MGIQRWYWLALFGMGFVHTSFVYANDRHAFCRPGFEANFSLAIIPAYLQQKIEAGWKNLESCETNINVQLASPVASHSDFFKVEVYGLKKPNLRTVMLHAIKGRAHSTTIELYPILSTNLDFNHLDGYCKELFGFASDYTVGVGTDYSNRFLTYFTCALPKDVEDRDAYDFSSLNSDEQAVKMQFEGLFGDIEKHQDKKVLFVLDVSDSVENSRCLGAYCESYLKKTFLEELSRIQSEEPNFGIYLYNNQTTASIWFDQVSAQDILSEFESQWDFVKKSLKKTKVSRPQDLFGTQFGITNHYDVVYVFSDFQDFSDTSTSVQRVDIQTSLVRKVNQWISRGGKLFLRHYGPIGTSYSGFEYFLHQVKNEVFLGTLPEEKEKIKPSKEQRAHMIEQVQQLSKELENLKMQHSNEVDAENRFAIQKHIENHQALIGHLITQINLY
ncbi:MAG: hypothetical protein KDD46_02130 [Bdellovibrionales bacterium]|nr:hypothetical protein [Bdellovibrionales bacterium]